MANYKRRNRSICQKSTIIAANLIRASSFVLAKVAFGATTQVHSGTSRGVSSAKNPVVGPALRPGNVLHTETAGSSVASYVKEPEKGDGVDAQAKDEPEKGKGINERVEEFIRKVRMKNRTNLSAEDYMANCIPPPPPVRKPTAVLHAYYR